MANWQNEQAQVIDARTMQGALDGKMIADVRSQVLDNLRGKSLFLYASNLNYGVDAINYGVIRFRQPMAVQTQAYNYTAENMRAHLSTRDIQVVVDTPMAVFYETFKLDDVLLKDGTTLEGMAIGTIAQSINYTMECEWLWMLATNSFASGNVIQIDISTDTTDSYKQNWKMMQLLANNIKQTFTAFTFGVNPNQIRAIVSPLMSTQITQAFGALIGTSQAFAALQAENANAFSFGGIDIVESSMLDTHIVSSTNPDESPYTKARDYDFSGILFLLTHPYASTIPFQYQDSKATVLFTNGNDALITRLKFGKGIILNEVIYAGIDANYDFDSNPKSVMSLLVDTIKNGNISGQQANADQLAGKKTWHRYVGSGLDELIDFCKNNGFDTSAKLKERFYTYSKGRLVRNNTSVAIPLNKVITVTALGQLTDKQAATILTAIGAKNSGVDISQLQAYSITDTGATIAPLDTSLKYTGTVNVSFTLPAKIQEEPKKSTNK